MAGHSKWANIKHRKARQDAVKGKAWSKASRAIMVAVKQGGSDPEMNLRLRYSIEDAKSVNMPKDTIKKAIEKASGDGNDGAVYQDIRYEGYAAGGVAVLVDCLTENVQRTAPIVRHAFEKHGGNMAKTGAVSFGFQSRGIILIESGKATEASISRSAVATASSTMAGLKLLPMLLHSSTSRTPSMPLASKRPAVKSPWCPIPPSPAMQTLPSG